MSQEFLLITLMAPMASFGELAGHERRGTTARPNRSALLGLLGAALGVRRDDKEKQNALRNTIDTAVRVEQSGSVLQDFHTMMPVPTTRSKKPQTRAQALATLTHADNAMITLRDYRMNVHFIAAYSLKEDCPWSLDDLKVAFEKPHFVLSLGRKSCPLSAPLDPHVVEADDMLVALSGKTQSSEEGRKDFITNSLKMRFSQGSEGVVAISTDALKSVKTNENKRMEQVHDEPLDRKHWYFASRQEAVFTLTKSQEEGT